MDDAKFKLLYLNRESKKNIGDTQKIQKKNKLSL